MALLARIDDLSVEPADVRFRFAEALLDIAQRKVVIGIRNAPPPIQPLQAANPHGSNLRPTRPIPKSGSKWLPKPPLHIVPAKRSATMPIAKSAPPRHSLDLALAGKGIAVLPTFIVDAQPTLQRVGETIPELTHDQWIVTHSDDQHCPRIPTGCALYCSHKGLKHTFD